MHYALFLVTFLGIPLGILGFLTYKENQKGRLFPATFHNLPFWLVVGIHVLVAVIYTTPWDNYLVATRVWYYNPGLISGIVIGWVPLEEYTFFILQSILIGLWLAFLAKRIPEPRKFRASSRMRILSALIFLVFFLSGTMMLARGWKQGNYLALILAWAAPPIALQMFFGADILWQRRKLMLAVLISSTIYLSAADCLAIGSGTWTISPDQSLRFLIAGVLPLEEFIFFLMTATLLTFGMVLLQARESRERYVLWFRMNQLHVMNHTIVIWKKQIGRALRGAYADNREN